MRAGRRAGLALLATLVSAGGCYERSDSKIEPLDLCTDAGCGERKHVQPSKQCSEGERWARDTNFAYEVVVTPNAPACTPHCGPNASASPAWPQNLLTSDALPSGACSEDGVVCNMQAEWLGTCPPTQVPTGPLVTFICRCSGASWRCNIDSSSNVTPRRCVAPDAGA